MAATIAPVIPLPVQAPDSGSVMNPDVFAANLIAADEPLATRITAALLRSLGASVTAILEASAPTPEQAAYLTSLASPCPT